MIRVTFFVFLAMLALSCASHRKKANCGEIRYRLDHMQYNEDQREWIEEEWRQCEAEYDSLNKTDRAKYQGIYSAFQDSSSNPKDSVSMDSSSHAEDLVEP